MKVQLTGSGASRKKHDANGFSLGEIKPRFGYGEEKDDLVLAMNPIQLANANGHWSAEAFLSRGEVSQLIDFLIADKRTFPEVVDKVFARLRQNVGQGA